MGTNDIESWSYHDLYAGEISGLDSLGISDAQWDCWINHYMGYWWEDIVSEGLEEYFTELGWDSSLWDEGLEPPSEDKYWDELTLLERAAARQLCYTNDLWDGIPMAQWGRR